MQQYGGRGGGPHMGYGQGQMGRMQQSMQYPPQALWRPGLPPPPAAGYMQAAGYAHSMAQPGRYPPVGGHTAPRPSAGSSAAQRGPGRREMDSLLEEIKAKQEQRKELTEKKESDGSPQGDAGVSAVNANFPNFPSFPNFPPVPPPAVGKPLVVESLRPPAAISSSGGSSWGAGGASAAADELASLLFLRELPSSASEDAICALFSRYGTVTAVDIVRSKDDGRIQGYVMIDSRENAQRAKDALQDRELDGVPLWIEWSKSHVPQGIHVESRAQSKDGKPRVVVVEIPADAKKRRTIDKLARYVSQEGYGFEKLIMQRESPEGMFDFLFHHDSPENIYYRWRMFAFAQRDNFKVWRTQTFRIYEGGRWWRPPSCEAAIEAVEKKKQSKFSSSVAEDPAAPNTAVSQVPNPATAVKAARGNAVLPAHWTQEDIDEERERQRLEERATQERQKRDRNRSIAGGKRLSDDDWSLLEQLLRNVSSTRASIMETMVFCLDKSEWAIEIAETITESLTIAETEIPLKVARLLVVSDILHNTTSSRQAAWTYRREFEKSLPDIFEQFEIGLQRSESKLQVSQAKDQIVRLLKVWEDWGLFAPQYLRGLEAAVVIGVRRLRLLSSKGDLSREPAWLEPKLVDWRRQHFSQLEKMCRTRGLRCSTAHLEATKQLSLEEARKEWLIDRLVTYELLAYDKEQARLQQAKEDAANKLSRRRSKYAMEDIDGEDCGDGFPMDESELDGEPIDLSTPGDIYNAVEMAKQAPEALANYLGTASSGAVLGSVISPSPVASAAEEVLSVISPEAEDKEMLDVQSSETLETEGSQTEAKSSEAHSNLLADIELEVMELRASLELKGAHRDAIQDACNKKRKDMMEEHEAKQSGGKKDLEKRRQEKDTAAAAANVKAEKAKDEKDKQKDKDVKEKDKTQKDKEKEKGKEKDLQKDKEREKETAKEKTDQKEREKEREKEKKKQEEAKAREAREKEKEKLERQKEREKEKEKQEKQERLKKEKEKECEREKEKERDRDREKGKEKVRPNSEKEAKEAKEAKEKEKDSRAKDKDREESKNSREKAKMLKSRSPPSKSPPSVAKKKVRR